MSGYDKGNDELGQYLLELTRSGMISSDGTLTNTNINDNMDPAIRSPVLFSPQTNHAESFGSVKAPMIRDDEAFKRKRSSADNMSNIGHQPQQQQPQQTQQTQQTQQQPQNEITGPTVKKLKGQYPRSSFYVGASGIYDNILMDSMKLNNIFQIQLTEDMSLRKVDNSSQFLLREDYTDELYAQSAQDLEEIEKIVKPYGPTLVDLYFRFVHPFYPILHKKVFVEKYERSYKEVSATLLSAVYLLAMELWENEAKLIGKKKPDTTKLYNIAKRSFAEVLERPKLTAVQAGLLLLQCSRYVPSAASGGNRKWILCSQVVSLTEELGLGVDCGNWKLPKWEKGLRRRLAWAVFFQDKWLSLVESRPSHLIPGVNWMVNDLIDDDFLESNASKPGSSGTSNRLSPSTSIHSSGLHDENSDVGKHFFKELINLSKILSEILNNFYSLSAVSSVNKIETVLSMAKPLQLKLKSWHTNLPRILSTHDGFMRSHSASQEVSPIDYLNGNGGDNMNENTGNGDNGRMGSGSNDNSPSSLNFGTNTRGKYRSPNCNSFLKLAYFVAEITLHRKIISALTVNDPQELIDVCRVAARTRLAAAIEFITQLKPENIHSFWYATASSDFAIIGVFAMILFITSTDEDEKKYYKDQIFNYRWYLKIISKNFYHGWTALKQFDTIYNQIAELQGPEYRRSENANGNKNVTSPGTQQNANTMNNANNNNNKNGSNSNNNSNNNNLARMQSIPIPSFQPYQGNFMYPNSPPQNTRPQNSYPVNSAGMQPPQMRHSQPMGFSMISPESYPGEYLHGMDQNGNNNS